MVNALGERSFCSKVLPIFTSTSKWTQSHLLLLQLQNCIYSFLPRKIQNWVLKRGWGFSKAAFQRTPTTQTSLLIPFTEEEEVQKIAKPEEEKSFQTVGGDTIFAIWPNQMSTSKIYYAWEIKRKNLTLNFKD